MAKINWRLMPQNPTPEMIQAACDATFGPKLLTPEEYHRIGYQAMWNAAQGMGEKNGDR